MPEIDKFRDYISQIRKCNDYISLINRYRIQDDWLVLLYGNKDKIYSTITRAFIDSPKPDGIRDEWILTDDIGGSIMDFDYSAGTAQVQVSKSSYQMLKGEKNQINGLDHSIHLMFHAHQKKRMENVGMYKALALAISSFGDYIIREKITAKFPKIGLNYIPK